ncbi:ABC transporter permease [Segeticoccus rhizosphaerae]|uniref:ABC transporter permease n=1 Tax=Segeticoccus rhizosphaerae TaxID=1104777 RepID=UPI00139056DD|nr:ABC transporter permease subunit [Ornithinicoccus soli]
MIAQGLVIGLCIAVVLAGLAATSELGRALMDALVTVFNPLPAIALLPLAMLWFGLGTKPLIFVIIMSVAWPAAISLHTGFSSVSLSLRRVGQNFGFSGFRQFTHIYLPAALPSILAAFRIAWAFAWRTAIAAEMVFGVSGSQGGLGYFIYVSRYNLDTADVFAGLMAIVIIGVAVERGILGVVERRTTVRWGVTR